jgi:peptidoglycan/LPS O-acetylase OafA/YrhL
LEVVKNKETTDRLDALTATRGIAAMLIVVFHFGLEVFPFSEAQRFFSKGNMAVSYFFTLSGFIMCYTYYAKPIGYKSYIVRRLARIGPVYWLAIVLSLFTIAQKENLLTATFLNVFFLQSYIPGYALTVNSPGWSLSVEMFFYLLFLVQASVILYAISQIAHLYFVKYSANSNAMHELVYYHPLGHLNSFMIGMAGYYFIDKPLSKGWLGALLVLAAIISSLLWLPISKHNGLLAPLFVLLILMLAKKKGVLLRKLGLVWLGEVSYSLYILQMPVYYICSYVNNAIFHFAGLAVFSFFIVMLIILSAISFRFIEKPLRKVVMAG